MQKTEEQHNFHPKNDVNMQYRSALAVVGCFMATISLSFPGAVTNDLCNVVASAAVASTFVPGTFP